MRRQKATLFRAALCKLGADTLPFLQLRDCNPDVCLPLLWLPISDWSLSAEASKYSLISSGEKVCFLQ